MPEEKKKGGFTFSDKIKNSKQASSKSFANRVPSKIGNDGKPRQTLFARTKRDVPFFAAAAAALLLLPFMYKYSGNVDEEPAAITPGYEDAIVNPDRSGFDFSGDPDGQISQLSGRDSMDLIVGLGKKQAEEEDADSLADLYRSGYDASSAKSSYASSDMEEEQNTTNIYKYRKQAAPQTRAAFRRSPTKVGNLKTAGLSGRGGGRPVGVWGGSMKKAANKVRSNGPTNSPKPVSLQPLQATGKPARSYFGQGAAQEAKRSKDAMSKANAGQALADAQVKAVEPGRIGGITGGPTGGPGSGSGKFERNLNFQGKEPWWWDMMKTRSQMEWQRLFEYKWGWIDWATKLVQGWAAGLLNCLVMGDDGGEPDSFLGADNGTGKKECCGYNEAKWKEKYEGKVSFNKTGCDAKKKEIAKAEGNEGCGWVDKSNNAGFRLSGWQARRACLGARVKGTALALDETSGCKNMANKRYEVVPQGDARKWHTYIYVIASNEVPQTLIDLNVTSPTGNRYDLCTDQDGRRIGSKHVASVGATSFPTKTPEPDDVTRYTDQGTEHQKGAKKVRGATNIQTISEKSRKAAPKEYKAAQAELKDAKKDLEAKKEQMEAAQHRKGELAKSANEVEKAYGPSNALTLSAKAEAEKSIEEHRQAIDAFLQAQQAVTAAEKRLAIAQAAARAATAAETENKSASLKTNISYKDTEHNITPPLYERDKSDILNSCVIYVQEGANFNWKNFKAAEIEAIEKWIRQSGVKKDAEDEEITRLAQKAFTELNFQEVRSVSMKQKLAFRMDSKGMDALPMILDRFQYAYIKHRGTAASSESRSGRQNVDKRKWRDEDKYIEGEPCPFDSEWSFDCVNDAEGKQAPTATVVWKKGYNNGVDESNIKAENVTASFVTANAPIALQVLQGATEGGHFGKTYTFHATFDGKMPKAKQSGIITWTLKLGDKNMMAECEYGVGGDGGVTPTIDEDDVVKDEEPSHKKKTVTKKDETKTKTPSLTREDGEGNTEINLDEVAQFAPQMKDIPKNIMDREKGGVTGRNGSYLPLPKPTSDVNGLYNKNPQACTDGNPGVMNSKLAEKFAEQVAAKYNNERKPALPLQVNPWGVSVSQFIDALHVAQEVGITQVPKAAVCELGRKFVRLSRDPHAGYLNKDAQRNRNAETDEDVVGDDYYKDPYHIYHNDMGAFLAYVSDSAIFYPAEVIQNGADDAYCDWRFIPTGSDGGAKSVSEGLGKCKNEGLPKMGRRYHYTNYFRLPNANSWAAFEKSLTPGMKQHPLKALVEGKGFESLDAAARRSGNRAKEGREYKQKIVGLLRESSPSDFQACEDFVGSNTTMAVADVLKYVTDVCTYGLNYKPYGAGIKGKGFEPDGSKPTSVGNTGDGGSTRAVDKNG